MFENYNSDVYLYYGDISRYGYSEISSLLEANTSKLDTACLVLITRGGDPGAGYRIARAFRHHYKNFNILIPDICKSAGTLLCVGADKLIFGDRGELGPLDIQISKSDEIHASISGLDLQEAMGSLNTKLMDSFRSFLLDMTGAAGLQTRMAADIAVKLATGLVSPITAKIDPLTLGEHHRLMNIALEYGRRLMKMSNSLDEDALTKLVLSYPEHGFVIDRKEAREIFKNVEGPSDKSLEVYDVVRELLKVTQYPPYQAYVRELKKSPNEPSGDNNEDIPKQHCQDEAMPGDHGSEEPSISGSDNLADGKVSTTEQDARRGPKKKPT